MTLLFHICHLLFFVIFIFSCLLQCIFYIFFFLMIRRPPRSTLSSSSAASDVYKRQVSTQSTGNRIGANARVMGWVVIAFSGLVYLTVAICAIVAAHNSRPNVAPEAALALVVAACLVSASTIVSHAREWRQPGLQILAVRIVLMVPIYSIESILAVTRTHSHTAIIWETLRESYEAFALWCFVRWLIAGLALEAGASIECSFEQVVVEVMSKKAERKVEHLAGVDCCMRPWVMGEEFLVQTKLGTMVYVWARMACTAAALIMVPAGVYHEGELFDLSGGYMWSTLILTCSQSWALYVLLLFHKRMHMELAALDPLLKFVSVKAIIFCSFWQGILLALLEKLGTKPPFAGDLSSGQLQDLLICFEMLAAATLMHLAFGVSAGEDCWGGDKTGSGCGDVRRCNVWEYWAGLIRRSARISADILSPSDVIKETEETAALLTASVEATGELQAAVLAHSTHGKLTGLAVEVLQARNLASGDVGGTSDPYAVVTLQSQDGRAIPGTEQRTQVVFKTLDPKWNQTIRYEDTLEIDQVESVLIEIFDEDFGRLGGRLLDDPLGVLTLYRSEFCDAGVVLDSSYARWHSL
eukprot:TRINITY_DN20588_c0_g2_i2.p1 TRINITY_DN20588_c0_g2~~TRINITY_DN20588_c0_g2_i2.p1  ORF type:complete len:583 (+),score=114.23 TRINITY_DN20588_c0_g2_i2:36-1784(+)